MTDKKDNTGETVFLFNETQRPIHIAGSKKENARLSTNIVISPLQPVAVPKVALEMSGVKQLMDKKALRQLSAAEVSKLTKEHKGVLTSDDD
ncbi:hypothetical protein D3C81_31830 [compost metagenome]